MHMTFRSRLIVSYTLVLAGLLAISAAVLIYTMRNSAERRLDGTLWVLGTSEAEGMVARLSDRNLKKPDDLSVFDVDYPEFSGYEEFRTQKYVTVINADRRVMDFSLNLPSRPMPMSEKLIDLALEGKVNYETAGIPGIGKLRIIYVPVLPRWTERFVVMVGIPTDSVGAEVGTLARQLATTSLFILVLAAIGGWLLSRRALRPIVETAVTLQHISDRTLHKRLPDSGLADEINHLVRVINELLERLDNAFDTQRRFTADASHEICTPLTVLKGATQVALLAKRAPEEYVTTLKSNLEEIDRLTKLATNLLMLARSDAGEQQSSKEALVLNDVVENVCTRLHPMAVESGVKLSCDSSELIIVNGEQNALQQIVLNLVTNAIRYTPAGGHVEVTLRRSPDGMAVVEVADTGIGIPPNALPRVFDRFYRGENARAQSPDGSGLGLAICQALAKAHNGHIEVGSEYGKGSRFKVFIPASPADKSLAEAIV
jgi:two-component system OmpR family sensor kinase